MAIFGYERTNAALVPDIVSDGDRLSDGASSVYVDLDQNVALPKFTLNLKGVPPVLPDLSPTDADELRRIIAAGGGATLERLPGYMVSLLLMAEGQHPPGPTVGGVIADHIRVSGKQISPLISDAELQSAWYPPDPLAAKSVGAHQINYLLEKRRQFGPIGGYLETLYMQRRGAEIVELTTEIAKEGVVSPLGALSGPKSRALLFEKVLKVGSTNNFLFLPLGTLLGDDGILQLMKSNGFQIAVLA
jgi:hypothetical protein